MNHQYNQGDMIQYRQRWTEGGRQVTDLGVITEVFEDGQKTPRSLYTVIWFPRVEKEYYYIKDLDNNEQVSLVTRGQ